jgi:hypothetical protein
MILTERRELSIELRQVAAACAYGQPADIGTLLRSIRLWKETRHAPGGKQTTLGAMNSLGRSDLDRIQSALEGAQFHYGQGDNRAALNNLRVVYQIIERGAPWPFDQRA